jgi:hypothetical protein
MSESMDAVFTTDDQFWRQESLVFTIQDGTDEYKLDVIPYLGDGPKATKQLTFPHPRHLEQSDLIALLKDQALQQGVRLVTNDSSSNPDAANGRHFRLVCQQNRLHNPVVAEENSKPKLEITRPTKQEERCPFSLMFNLDERNKLWVLSSGSGSSEHKNHPRSTSSLVPGRGLRNTTTNTTALTTMTTTAPSMTPRQRRRVVLGITGSVAAIKGPEIAVRLVQELDVDVRVLLTHGGHTFWQKAQEYNPHYWNQLQELTLAGDLASIRIHCTCHGAWSDRY